MSKIISGVEYNYEITYVEDGVKKVISRATTSTEAESKRDLAIHWLWEPLNSTVLIESI